MTPTPHALPDQVVAAAWCLMAVLHGIQQREKLLGVPERIAAFHRTCDETLAFIHREIAGMRIA